MMVVRVMRGGEVKLHFIRFVVDLLYNKLYNKSTTNPQQIESCTTNPQHLDMSRCCGFVVDARFVVDLLYSLLYNKSTTNRISGV